MPQRFSVKQLLNHDAGMETTQSVLILAVSALVLLGMRFLWDPNLEGSSNLFGAVSRQFDVIFNGGDIEVADSGAGGSPSNEGRGGDDGDEADSPSTPQTGNSSLTELIKDIELQLETETDPERIEQLKENLRDAQIALEVKIFGESPTVNQLWQDYLDSLKPPKKGSQRYYGFSISGKLPLGVAEASGTEAYLYDCQTGQFHKYTGIGAAGGIGAFLGFVVKPLTVDLNDPSEFESLTFEGSATVSFFFGAEGSWPVNGGWNDLDNTLGLAIGFGGGLSGGDSFVKYGGTTNSFFLRWFRNMLWGSNPCD